MKNKFEEIKKFVKKLKDHWGDDFKFNLDTIGNKYSWHSNSKIKGLDTFFEMINWHDNIMELSSEDKEYVFGEKVASVDDLKNRALSTIKKRFWDSYNQRKYEVMDTESEYYDSSVSQEDFDEEYTEECNSSGYAGVSEVQEIEGFWERLTEKNMLDMFIYEEDELGLDGHRWYFFSQANLEPVFFSLLTNKKNLKSRDFFVSYAGENFDGFVYESEIDRIEFLYPPLFFKVPTIEESDDLFSVCSGEKHKEEKERFNHMVKSFEYFHNIEFEDIKEKVSIIEKLKF
jgi:hypothetical protein